MKAHLWRISIDHEGESTVVLKAPSSELAEVLKLNLLQGKLIEAQLTAEE